MYDWNRRARTFRKIGTCESVVDVKLPGHSCLRIDAVPIEESICNIASLLYFEKHDVRTDGMHSSRGQEDAVAGFRRELMKCARHCPICDRGAELLRGHALLKAGVNAA